MALLRPPGSTRPAAGVKRGLCGSRAGDPCRYPAVCELQGGWSRSQPNSKSVVERPLASLTSSAADALHRSHAKTLALRSLERASETRPDDARPPPRSGGGGSSASSARRRRPGLGGSAALPGAAARRRRSPDWLSPLRRPRLRGRSAINDRTLPTTSRPGAGPRRCRPGPGRPLPRRRLLRWEPLPAASSGAGRARVRPAIRDAFAFDTEQLTSSRLPDLPEARYAGRCSCSGQVALRRWSPPTAARRRPTTRASRCATGRR